MSQSRFMLCRYSRFIVNNHDRLCVYTPCTLRIYVQRFISSQSSSENKGFFGNFIENIKSEMAKNKEMKESIKKFREEAQKLEESEALKKARLKFETIEKETVRSSQHVKEQLSNIKEKLKVTLEDAQKTELGKKSLEMKEEITKQAKSAAHTIAKQSQQLGNIGAFRAISEGVKAIKEEVDEATIQSSNVYRAPKKLRKRADSTIDYPKTIEINTEEVSMELHKDSKWHQSWQNFKNNNQYVNKIFDWKTKYDESNNPVIRASRLLTDKVTDIFGSMFQKTQLSEVLTEICKVDPSFDKNAFLKDCADDIIPNILEATLRGDLEILKDWCHEAAYNRLREPIEKASKMGLTYHCSLLDISNVDLAMGKIMDQGPVLVITFQTQQIMCATDAKGEIKDGDPDEILRYYYVWVLCRDQEELNPKAAWRLIDLNASITPQLL